MKPFVAYLRTSTDDKGQQPERQIKPIEARAAKMGRTILATIVDEGTSGGTPAMDRPKFQEAYKLAKKHKADVIVESVDRLTRCGWQDVGATAYLLNLEQVDLVFADIPDGDDMMLDIILPLMAYSAKMTRKRLKETTKSGMRLKMAQGKKMGRPRKPDLTDDEYEQVLTLMASGKSPRQCAMVISRQRGAYEIIDPTAHRRRKVSGSWIQNQVANRPETLGLLGRVVRRAHADPSQKGAILEPESTGEAQA